MFSRCPGADGVLQPVPEVVRCPHCRREVEMFTNEMALRCYHCGGMIFKDRRPSCFDWCKHADRCASERGMHRN